MAAPKVCVSGSAELLVTTVPSVGRAGSLTSSVTGQGSRRWHRLAGEQRMAQTGTTLAQTSKPELDGLS